MAGGTAWIKTIGIEQTRRMFDVLPVKMQKDTARKVLRAAAKRVRKPVAAATPKKTGNLAALIAKAPIRARSRIRNLIRIGWLMPTREELGIAPDAPGYYPTALEYGFAIVRKGKIVGKVAPKRYIRGTVDRAKGAQYLRMSIDFGKRIKADAMKLGNHKKIA